MLAAGSLIQFVRFMQITLLIILPILALVFGIVAIIHYRKKKKRPVVKRKDAVERLIDGTPDQLNYENEEADYVYYDHFSLIREYKSKLVYSHARYTALQRDYERVQDKCNALLLQAENPLLKIKKSNMKDINSSIQPGDAESVQSIPGFETERTDLLTKLEELNKSYQSLERENENLLGQLGMLTATDEEKAVIVNRWKEKNDALQDQIAEQEYLKDVVEEKKMQIGFLQQQLEQRILKFHQSEKQSAELRKQLDEVNKDAEESKTALQSYNSVLFQKDEHANQLQGLLNEKEGLLTEKLNTITWLESTLQETKQQNEMLNAMASDNNDRVISLQEALVSEQSKVIQLEQKIEDNRQRMKRLYQEISNCIEPEMQESPVIELKPAYG